MNTTVSQNTSPNADETLNKNYGEGVLSAELGLDELKKNYEQLEKIEIEGTPFTMVGNKEIGYKVTHSIFAISETYNTKENCIKAVKKPSWDMIGNFIFSIMAGRDMMMQEAEKLTKKEN